MVVRTHEQEEKDTPGTMTVGIAVKLSSIQIIIGKFSQSAT